MKFKAVIVAMCLAPVAFAQPPEVPAEVRGMISDLAREQGMVTFGDVYLSRLDDGAAATIQVKVAPGKRTYVAVVGDGPTLDIKARAKVGAKEFLPELGYRSGQTVIQIPENNGDAVSLSLDMSCEDIDCGYFVQAFVR